MVEKRKGPKKKFYRKCRYCGKNFVLPYRTSKQIFCNQECSTACGKKNLKHYQSLPECGICGAKKEAKPAFCIGCSHKNYTVALLHEHMTLEQAKAGKFYCVNCKTVSDDEHCKKCKSLLNITEVTCVDCGKLTGEKYSQFDDFPKGGWRCRECLKKVKEKKPKETLYCACGKRLGCRQHTYCCLGCMIDHRYTGHEYVRPDTCEICDKDVSRGVKVCQNCRTKGMVIYCDKKGITPKKLQSLLFTHKWCEKHKQPYKVKCTQCVIEEDKMLKGRKRCDCGVIISKGKSMCIQCRMAKLEEKAKEGKIND